LLPFFLHQFFQIFYVNLLVSILLGKKNNLTLTVEIKEEREEERGKGEWGYRQSLHDTSSVSKHATVFPQFTIISWDSNFKIRKIEKQRTMNATFRTAGKKWTGYSVHCRP